MAILMANWDVYAYTVRFPLQILKTHDREQLYCNNRHQKVVTSIHFVKIKTIFLQNPLDSNPGKQVLSDLQSSALTTRSSTYVDNSLIIRVMNKSN